MEVHFHALDIIIFHPTQKNLVSVNTESMISNSMEGHETFRFQPLNGDKEGQPQNHVCMTVEQILKLELFLLKVATFLILYVWVI